MRNSVLGVLAEMVTQVLSKEGLDDKDKKTRDQFLDKLEVMCHQQNYYGYGEGLGWKNQCPKCIVIIKSNNVVMGNS